MKLVHKIYIVSIIVFLLFFELGMYFMINRVYAENRKQYAFQAQQQLSFTAEAMESDFSAGGGVKISEEDVLRIYSHYSYYYEQNGWYMELYKDDRLLASNTPQYDGTRKELDSSSQEPSYVVRKVDGSSWLYAAEDLKEPYDGYRLVCAEKLSELDEFWDSAKKIISVMGTVAFFGFAVITYLLLRHMTMPLTKLTAAVDRMAEGERDQTVDVHGKDEIAVLGNKFNSMSGKIQEQMDTISAEASERQTFIHNLAHELRTPLTAIYGYSELMEKSKVSEEEEHEYLGYIMGEAKRMEKLADNLLKLALMQSEEIEFEMFDAGLMIKRVSAVIGPVCQEKNISLEVENQLSEMWGNEALVESLIINLLQNAVRASDEGKKIYLSVSGTKNAPSIVVKDNGIGMSEEDLKHIFAPFYRVDKARSRKMGGAGLGLALSKQIAECHHGTLVYESQKGAGTTARADLFIN